jgi:hypothetical protein
MLGRGGIALFQFAVATFFMPVGKLSLCSSVGRSRLVWGTQGFSVEVGRIMINSHT